LENGLPGPINQTVTQVLLVRSIAPLTVFGNSFNLNSKRTHSSRKINGLLTLRETILK
jgi:hypothetical protein